MVSLCGWHTHETEGTIRARVYRPSKLNRQWHKVHKWNRGKQCTIFFLTPWPLESQKETYRLKCTENLDTRLVMYFIFKSNQPLEYEVSIVCTLHHRADCVISDTEALHQEKQHINEALHECGYPTWAFNKALQPWQASWKQGASNCGWGWVTDRTTLGIPRVKGMSEKINTVINLCDIESYIKPTRKPKKILRSSDVWRRRRWEFLEMQWNLHNLEKQKDHPRCVS